MCTQDSNTSAFIVCSWIVDLAKRRDLSRDFFNTNLQLSSCLVFITYYAPYLYANPYIYGSYYGHVASALVSSRLIRTMLIPSCSVVHRSMQLVFNAYSKHLPEL